MVLRVIQVVCTVALLSKTNALPLPANDASSSSHSWIYVAIIVAVSVSLAVLMFSRSAFSRWRRQSTLFRIQGPLVPDIRERHGQSRLSEPSPRQAQPSQTRRRSLPGFLIGLLGSPTWEIMGVTKGPWGWALRPELTHHDVERPSRLHTRCCTACSGIKTTSCSSISLLVGVVAPQIPTPSAGPNYHFPSILSLTSPQIHRNSDLSHRDSSHSFYPLRSPFHSQPEQAFHYAPRISSAPERGPWTHRLNPIQMNHFHLDVLQNRQLHGQDRNDEHTSLDVNYAGQSIILSGSREAESNDPWNAPGLKISSNPTIHHFDISGIDDPQRLPRPSPTSSLRRPAAARCVTLSPPNRPSPLRSMILPVSSTAEVSAYLLSEEKNTPSNSMSSTPSRGQRRSPGKGHLQYAHLGLGHPYEQHSTLNCGAPSKSSHHSQCMGSLAQPPPSHIPNSATLEDMIDQLAHATSEWDDSVFVSDEFKVLMEASKTPVPAFVEDSMENLALGTISESVESPHNIQYSSFHSFGEGSRSPLSSIPEEDLEAPS